MEEDKEGRASILIVEDDRNLCNSMRLILEKKGYDTVTAGTVQSDRKKVKERFFNVALVDLMLPDHEGVELLGFLKKLHPDMEIIMMTAFATLETAVKALNEGAAAYVTKPLDMDDVLGRIGQLVEKQNLVAENQWLFEEAQEELEDRRRAEESLRESEEKFRNLIEGSLQGILIQRDQKALFLNKAFADIFGYESPEEILQLKTLTALIDEGEGARQAAYREARLKGQDASDHYIGKGMRKDGSTIWLDNFVTVVDWEGAPAVQVATLDITERKKAEEGLRKGDAVFHGLAEALESISEGFALFDENDLLVFSNLKMKQLFGSVANLLEPGVSFADLIRAQIEKHPMAEAVGREEQYLAERLERHMNPGDPIEQEFESGETVLLKEYRTQSGGFVCIRTDITESKQREKELTEKTQRLLEEITERKRAEEALRKSEERTRKFINSAPAFLGYADKDLIYQQINEPWGCPIRS